ncbi:MAG: RidA family protein [Alphaproteobacteria bacterium]
MSQITRINADNRMSEVIICGDRIYTCGIVADKMAGKSVYEQTKETLAQIDALLAQAGSDKEHMLKANIWLSDMGTFDEMNRAWDAWVVPGKTPARATVEARLAAPEYAVEIMIEAIARG